MAEALFYTSFEMGMDIKSIAIRIAGYIHFSILDHQIDNIFGQGPFSEETNGKPL